MAASNPQYRMLRWLLLLTVLTRVDEMRAQSAATADQMAATKQDMAAHEAANFARARVVVDRVLRGPEFQRDLTSGWWETKKEQLTRTLGRFFNRVSRLSHAAPWLARGLEWLCFGGGVLGLLLFILRGLRRQRLSVSLAGPSTSAVAWTRQADEWAERAVSFAHDGQWRDAVHCLYWAAIVLLESRRAWKHNPTRTPRDYVKLLLAGSPQQKGLHGLTQIFERNWYGQRETTSDEYDEAHELFDGLNTASSLAGPLKTEPLQQAKGVQA